MEEQNDDGIAASSNRRITVSGQSWMKRKDGKPFSDSQYFLPFSLSFITEVAKWVCICWQEAVRQFWVPRRYTEYSWFPKWSHRDYSLSMFCCVNSRTFISIYLFLAVNSLRTPRWKFWFYLSRNINWSIILW